MSYSSSRGLTPYDGVFRAPADVHIVVGQLLDTVVSEVQSNGRIARLTIDPVVVARTQVGYRLALRCTAEDVRH